MKVRISSLLYSIGIAVLLAGFAVLYVISSSAVAERPCVEMVVEYGDDGQFVTAEDIRAEIERNYGEFITRRLDSLNVFEMEKALEESKVIKSCEAWISDHGTLNMTIYQRKPVVRFQRGAEGFYADKDGVVFPLQERFTERVLIVEGAVPSSDVDWIRNTVAVAEHINHSATWNGFIIQLHVQDNGELVMIPKTGEESFLFGRPEDIETKFSKMKQYYRSIAPLGKNYKRINLKYADQIICR